MATRLATKARAAGLAAMIGATTARGMINNSVLPDARADTSCRCSRSTTISPKTSPALRTPWLTSLPLSSAKMRTVPDLITYKPSARSPALHTVSPNASQRDCAA